MPTIALGLVLLAAGAHALWNLLAKTAQGGGAPFVWLASVFGAAVLTPAALVIVAVSPPSLGAVAFMAGSGVIHAVYFACLLRGYREGDLSLVYPLARGSGPVIATIAAIVLLGERPGPVVLTGGAIVVLAILSLAAPAVRAGAPGTSWALATGLTIALYTIWDKHAVDGLGASPVVYFWATEIGVALVLTPFVLGARRALTATWREDRRGALGVALLSGFAYILVLYALRLADVSYVAPAREVSVLFGAVLGAGVLGEADPRRRIACAAAIVVGIAALALG
ncbi:MAG: EamA family transporter [Thermoleophilaceae bacterium]|nr:EamA family transporter [Thermoleophilaceae bacterium]